MTITEARPEAKSFVEAVIRYTDPASAGAKLNSQDHDSSTFKLLEHTFPVYNARLANPKISFEQNGFTMFKHKTDVNLLDKEAVTKTYYGEAAEIVKALTGASDVIVFLDLIRSEDRSGEPLGAEPAGNAHIDFDERSVKLWVKTLRPNDADRLLAKRRILNMNLWRPIRSVERRPLAICDAQSVSTRDLIPIMISGRPSDPGGPFSGYNLAYNPNHRWWYYPDLQTDEVLAFKIYDSDDERPYLTAHTAFDDPASREGAPKRISHEIRTIAFFD
ncbi:MAG TPA: CmcJ/NvfI family oxidoreductase [Alphaproteobacteria bacterium]|nr:CmcJ/NvfI family oxidoreductase [Alphaproteobacteria bacterium]